MGGNMGLRFSEDGRQRLLPDYRIIRSDRKTLGIQITPEGELVVRSPRRMKTAEIEKILREKADWIEVHMQKLAAQPEQPAFTREELEGFARQALEVIPRRTAYYADIMGVSYGRITIRNQHTRWGSCSSAGNLNFNCLLALAPPEVLDYVVVHELSHRREMNHSDRFWNQVEAVLPDYRERRKWLKENGGALIRRLP